MEKENGKIALSKIEIEDFKYTENFSPIVTMYRCMLKYGQCTFAHSISVRKSYGTTDSHKYSISFNRTSKILHMLCYFTMGFLWIVELFGERISPSKYKIINWIKRLTHLAFLVQYLTYYVCLEGRRKQSILLKIFAQFDVVQNKFASLGMEICSQPKVQLFTIVVCFANTISCMIQSIVFTLKRGDKWTEIAAQSFMHRLTLNAVDFNIEEVHSSVTWILAGLGVITSFFVSNLLYFLDSLLMVTIVSIWIVFRRLNAALDSKFLTHDDLKEVIDLHLNASKLMNLINKWISPIILVSTVSTLIYVCFWTNYFVQDLNFRWAHIVCIFFVLRNVFIFLMAADVNSQAHQISVWLEVGCSNKEKLPDVDNIKFQIFTTQVYNRDAIGFKGLNYFTITSSFLSAIIGLIMTYTVVVTQFIVDSNVNSTSNAN